MRLYGCSITGRCPAALYEPVGQRLLPLDAQWQHGLTKIHWPSANLPEVMGQQHRDIARTCTGISFYLALPGLRRIPRQ